MRAGFAGVVRALFQLQVSGLENVPRHGAFVAAVNHLSIADPALVLVSVPRQMMVFAADKWRANMVARWVVETLGVIWVARGQADRAALQQALAVLRAGWPLGLAPEGTRSPTQALQPGKSGAAYLADRAGVPVLPIALWGTEALPANLRRLRRTTAHLAVGSPFRLPGNGRARSAELAANTDEIMCRIAALLPEAYRGVYTGCPRVAELQKLKDGNGPAAEH